MNENYTSGIQKVLKYAKEEAIRLANTFVGSEHLLLGIIKDTEMVEDPNGKYNDGDANGKVEIEKGTGESRSFTKELEEMVYNVGMEYWYTDAFALRAGYIHDYEGKIFNPTFGAGIRLLQYGFDFGYTAGEQGHPRANTMFFSINIKL